MAVKVVVPRGVSGTPTREETHASAEHFYCRDGMLAVMESHFNDSRTIAIYAPGVWSSVERVPARSEAAAA
jgi:hypothetical protein